jgi:hypothetical protein
MLTFRLATLNVHLFQSSLFFHNNIFDLVSILEPLNLDLIAVQEIRNNREWKPFFTDLSFQYSIYEECHKDLFGTSIASRYPIASSFHIASTPCSGEMKCLLQCSLDGFDRLKFAVTLLQPKEKDNGCIFVYLCVRQ